MTRRAPDLAARLDALSRAVELARGRCDPILLAAPLALVAHASARARLSPERTVVALAGGTGSGKSTLFNMLAGQALAPTGVRRPTTSRSRAAIWPSPGDSAEAGDASALLDWLDVRDRHDVPGGVTGSGLDGLLLIDLPDFDSTAQEHRVEADRLTEVVDLLVWVLDPQKYADAAVHERYLRPLSTHGEVMVIVLNQIDRLDPSAAQSCQRHLRQLLEADALPRVPIIATSATRGDGLARLADELTARVRTRTAAVHRLQADIDAAVAQLAPLCASAGEKRGREAARSEEALVRGLAEAAGVQSVADAAAASYRLRATARMGWPLTRWLTRLRVNPLRKLHLQAGSSGVTSVPVAGGIQRAQVSNALRDIVADRTSGVAAEWRRSATAVVDAQQAVLPTELDRAVRAADLSATEKPRWWTGVRVVHYLLLAAAIAGALWLGVLAGASYLQFPHPSVHIGQAPLPTVLLLGGLGAGLLLALLMRPCVGAGARRRRARARRSLDAGIRSVARDSVLTPLAAELDAAEQFCAALGAARR